MKTAGFEVYRYAQNVIVHARYAISMSKTPWILEAHQEQVFVGSMYTFSKLIVSVYISSFSLLYLSLKDQHSMNVAIILFLPVL